MTESEQGKIYKKIREKNEAREKYYMLEHTPWVDIVQVEAILDEAKAEFPIKETANRTALEMFALAWFEKWFGKT